jgi:hypothetical protein
MTVIQFSFCTYEESWTGEFPWDSVCTATVKDLKGNVVKQFRFSTDINPRGETTADSCRRWAKFYCPPNVTLTEIKDTVLKEYESGYLDDRLEAGIRSYDFFKNDRPIGYPGREGLASRPHMRRWWRERWCEARSVRRWWRAMAKNHAHLLLFMVTGIDYLYNSPYRLDCIPQEQD